MPVVPVQCRRKFLGAGLDVSIELGPSQEIPCLKIFLIPGMIALRTQRNRPLPPSLFLRNDVPGILTNQISRDKVERSLLILLMAAARGADITHSIRRI